MKKAWLIIGIMAAVFTFTGAAMAADDPTIILNDLDHSILERRSLYGNCWRNLWGLGGRCVGAIHDRSVSRKASM